MNISKNTKIVCTIGPASDNYDTLSQLIDAGMNIMRLNFSHGEYKDHLAKIELIRQLEKDKGYIIPIILDTKGPEVRCHLFKDGKAEIQRDSIVRISMEEILGDETKFSVTYSNLFDDVEIGNKIRIDDGNLELDIIEKDFEKRELVTKARNTHTITNRKGVNAPFTRLSMPFISKKDEEDLKFGCENGIDYVAASFTRRPEDILEIKKVLAKYGRPDIGVIAKIENQEGVDKINEIIDVSDGIMVARGDLGVEVPSEVVPVIQSRIIEQCRIKGKPVITATQMLDSMQKRPVPTRAEVSDVANAIHEGTDCVMLSAESASGEYPVLATEMQAKISKTMEKYLDYEKLAHEAYDTSEKNNSDAISNSVANTALLIGAKLIVTISGRGTTPRRISKARPCCPIVCISSSRETLLKLGLFWGVYGILVPKVPNLIEEMEVLAIIKARDLGVDTGDTVILTGGTPAGAKGTNFMKILTLKNLAED
ncbi:MAG: pyruvate kinase [Erysipelotrichales bacterium]|nr:pyruvate kinase [Erysipelotrichales bacterium]